MKWAEWLEPFGNGPEAVYCRMSFSDIVQALRRKDWRYDYLSAEEVFMDFIVIHWAKIIND